MLSDLEILEALVDRSIVITPILSIRQFQPSSIDLRLGFHFKTVRNSGIAALDPIGDLAKLRMDTESYTTDLRVWVAEPFYLYPGDFALATTLEYVRLSNQIAGTLEGKSSLGRLGVTVHSTAGFIDPGFTGRITYEMQNEGTQTVALYAGMRVAQLCFDRLNKPAIRAYGGDPGEAKYQLQLTTTSSKWYDDPELDVFRTLAAQRRPDG